MSYLTQRRSGQVVSITLTTGGAGYTAPPTVTLSGGGGVGAQALAHMAGTQVQSIVITNGGIGYTSAPTVSVTGTAAATAAVYSGALRPLTFVRSRFNDLYGFDGMGRGVRWNGADGTMQPVGIQKPYKGPSITVSNASMRGYVDAVRIISPGSGYVAPPTVTFSGGSPSTPATGRALVSGGVVTSVTITEPGDGYQSAPIVSLTPSTATGATFRVNALGGVQSISLLSGGTGYTSTPTVRFSTLEGLVQAYASATTNEGKVYSVSLLSAGTGAITDATADIIGGGGTGASVSVKMQYGVQSVTVTNGGTGFPAAPVIQFQPNVVDVNYSPASATASVSGGSITSVKVLSGGSYLKHPTVFLGDYTATAMASIANVMTGTYQCAIRYFDNSPEQFRGAIYSSISDLVEVKVPEGASQLTWTLQHAGLDDRVAGVELWRTTSDQSVLLFRVAKIMRTDAAFSGTYTDTLSDDKLTDDTRSGYGLLPVTLPSGQLNARRFGVPPSNLSVACMFQDRLWMAVDSTGEKPNSLFFSEVDEPESVPVENEIVVQENSGDSDALVALIPLGASLLCVQSRHIYKLQYVAQPVLDASVMLAAYRGILNWRCWDVMAGVAYIADSYGLYAFDGRNEEPVSVAVDDLWRNGQIDFSKSDQFFVRADLSTKVVRFFYCRSQDARPVQALCYCTATKAWWTEGYAQQITASAPLADAGQQSIAYGLGDGSFARMRGYSDRGTAISYEYRSGNMPLVNEDGKRGVSVTYTPTASDSFLSLRQYFNGSSVARPNAVASDRGDGFVAKFPGSEAVLNMVRTRSSLGDASGVAKAMFYGGMDDRAAGSDRHMAIGFSGTHSSSGASPVIHSVVVEGTT